MANKLYAKGAQKTLGKQIDWENDDLRAIVVSSSYVASLSTHEFYSDVSAYVLASAVTLTSKSIAGGVFDADDINVTMLAGVGKAIIIFKYDADPTAAPLLVYIDNILGFPITTSGGVLPIVWDNGASKIVSFLGG